MSVYVQSHYLTQMIAYITHYVIRVIYKLVLFPKKCISHSKENTLTLIYSQMSSQYGHTCIFTKVHRVFTPIVNIIIKYQPLKGFTSKPCMPETTRRT